MIKFSEKEMSLLSFFQPLFDIYRSEIRETLTNKYAALRNEYISNVPVDNPCAFLISHPSIYDINRLKSENAKFSSIYLYGLKLANIDPKEHRNFLISSASNRSEFKRAVLSVESELEKFKPFYDTVYRNVDMFASRLDALIKDTVDANEFKLKKAILKELTDIEIKSVSASKVFRGNQGIEGVFEIVLINGKKIHFNTRSIFAGGYNIQKFHYRYLMKISE
jgi:hypothetical protein